MSSKYIVLLMENLKSNLPEEWYAADIEEDYFGPYQYQRFIVSVKKERILEIIRELIGELGNPLDVVLNTLHNASEVSRKDIAENVDPTVLHSSLCEAEDLLINDDCFELTVRSSERERPDQHKSLVILEESGNEVGDLSYDGWNSVVLPQNKLIHCYNEVEACRIRYQRVLHSCGLQRLPKVIWPECVELLMERSQSPEHSEMYLRLCEGIGLELDSEF